MSYTISAIAPFEKRMRISRANGPSAGTGSLNRCVRPVRLERLRPLVRIGAGVVKD